MYIKDDVFHRSIKIIFGDDEVAVEYIEELVEVQLCRANVISNLQESSVIGSISAFWVGS
jgi:hypothetical protein